MTQKNALEGTSRFRSRGQTGVLLSFGLILGLLFASQASRTSVAADAADKAIVIGVAILLSGGCIWVALRPVLVTDASGVVVRNIFTTRRIAWSDVQGFRIGRYKLLGAVAIIDLADDSSTHAFAIQVPNVARGRAVTRESEIVDELNRRLRRARERS